MRSVILPQWMICRQVHPTSFRKPPPNIHRYVTKKRRFLADLKKRTDWAERLLTDEEERKQKALENAGKETEPHMLHVVYLLKPLKGRPWWEKKITEELHIEELNQPVILKNIPSINRLLDEIKHLIRVLPLRFPHGMPEHESDFEHTFINSRGEMIVKKRLKEFEPGPSDIVPKPEEEKWKLQLETVQKELEKQLRSYSVHAEFFKPVYRYKRNEDQKEYRYNFNKDVPKYEW